MDFKLRPFRFESQSHQKPLSPCLCGFSLDRIEKSLPDGISCVESLAALADLGLLKATSFQQCESKMRFVGSFHSCLHLRLRSRENHPMTTQLWVQGKPFQRCVVQVVSNCVWFRPLCILPCIDKFSIIYMSLGCTCNRYRSLPTQEGPLAKARQSNWRVWRLEFAPTVPFHAHALHHCDS